MKKIAVFCAASEQIDAKYVAVAREVGALLGSMGCALVYGGARAGLMEATASAAKEAGAHIVGVVPVVLEERNRVSGLIDEKIRTRHLSDRKDIMLLQSDVVVTLPGGIGSLDEIFTVAASHTIGYHHKMVILYNMKGFWNSLIAMLDDLQQKGMIRGDWHDYIEVANNLEELKAKIADC